MKVTILQGIPGSGKSSLIPPMDYHNPRRWVVSADRFFLDEAGNYNFDPKKLPEAHGLCLRNYASLLGLMFAEQGTEIVVDNTNTTVAEIAPYYALAQAYGAQVRIIYLPCLIDVGAARNLHGVSREGCERMAANIEIRFERESPPWWKRVWYHAETFNWETTGW